MARTNSLCIFFWCVAVQTVAACATVEGPTSDGTAPVANANTRLADQELRRQRTCEQIREEMVLLGFNPMREYPVNPNRELGDPGSPVADLQRLQRGYQRNQCHLH